MMRTALTAVLLAGLSTVFFADTSYAQNRCGSQGTFNNLESVGLTADNRLVCFREQGGGGVRNIGTISGLAAGDTLVGIDFRPATGVLYGVGQLGNIYSFAAGQSGDIQATLVAPLVDMVTMTPILLNGSSFGVDFNPVPDRLRITSDTGQNLRANVDNGITNIDGTLNNGMGATVLGVTASAYTNNDADPATVTLLNSINTLTDQLAAQAPANAGTQNPLGALSLDSGAPSTFDIFSLIRTVNGVATTTAVRGLAAFTPAGATAPTLYTVNLATGRAVARRNFGDNNQIVGIAVPLLQGN